MVEEYSVTQKQRLVELNAKENIISAVYPDKASRNQAFIKIESELVKQNRRNLNLLLDDKHMSLSMEVEMKLNNWLTEEIGFTRVETPTLVTSSQLDKMGIEMKHPLREQVFWVDKKKCLRPMLALNLYEVMRDMHKITNAPIRIFEVGSCFRKESQGKRHLNEFKMLNMVELAGTKEGKQIETLKQFARGAMNAVGIDNYDVIIEQSTVYGKTLDIEVEGVEIASGAFGPHPLDSKWGVFDTWVGIGFGIERIAMVKGGYRTIRHAGKSNQYIDGISLKL